MTNSSIPPTERTCEMTDELKFFDPETGAELPRVPKAAPIPAHTSYGFILRDGSRGWKAGGLACAFDQLHGVTYFTREPIELPKPPLPTEPGAMIRAVDTDGDECALMIRLENGGWCGVDQNGIYRMWGDKSIASWEPMTAILTETWERLRVLDPKDKRDRVDADGVAWRYSKDFEGWECESGMRHHTLGEVGRHYGPLRFADELTDDE